MAEYQPYLFSDFQEQRDEALFEMLRAAGRIKFRSWDAIQTPPEKLDTKRLMQDQRIQGMLLGVAVGDSLGNSTEYRYDAASRNKEFGTIVDHLPIEKAGRLSDDSQTTFWTVERLLAKHRFEVDDLVGIFADRVKWIVGMGKNTEEALKRHGQRLKYGDSLVDQPAHPTNEGRGNGALMRFSPVVLPHLTQPSPQLWEDAVLSSYMTHPHATALAAMVPLVGLLWKALAQPAGSCPSPTWWLDEYLRIGADLETRTIDFPIPKDPIPKWFKGFDGTLCDFLDTRFRQAFKDGIPFREACSLNGFGSRADVIQTIPTVLYVLMLHADRFESAIVAAVNDTKDNDTIAAIAGAFLGALHGKSVIPQRWLEGIRSYSLQIEGRESMSDLEAMYRLSEEAERIFCA